MTYRVTLDYNKLKNYLNPKKMYDIKDSANVFELAVMMGHFDIAFKLSQAMNTDLMSLMNNYVNSNHQNPNKEKYSAFKAYVNFLKRSLAQDSIRNDVNLKQVFVNEFYKNMHLLNPDGEDLSLIMQILDYCISDMELVTVLDIALKSESTIRIAQFIQENYSSRILKASKEHFYLNDLHNPNGLLLVKYYLHLVKECELTSNLNNKYIITVMKNILTLQTATLTLDIEQIKKLWKMLDISKGSFFDPSEYSEIFLFLCQLSQINNYNIKKDNFELYQSLLKVFETTPHSFDKSELFTLSTETGLFSNHITLFSPNQVSPLTSEQINQDINNENSLADNTRQL